LVFPTPEKIGEELLMDITGPKEFKGKRYFLALVRCRQSQYV
jgi:hypothetical protein